mmetsp:Transcript_69234/g.165744  ORF Transcript_69234/g.165744 Transcript_69234/m.165744 type:complete len:141 (-) Transcript_69234:15-437(-)
MLPRILRSMSWSKQRSASESDTSVRRESASPETAPPQWHSTPVAEGASEVEKVQVRLAGMKDALAVTQKLLGLQLREREKDMIRMNGERRHVEQERDELRRERDELAGKVLLLETAHSSEAVEIKATESKLAISPVPLPT